MKHFDANDGVREQAALYALGALAGDDGRLLEEHMAGGCEVCAAEVKSFESVVAALAFDATAEQPRAELKRRLLDRISDLAPRSIGPPRPEFVSIRSSEGDWRQIAEGIFEKHLFSDRARGSVTTLVRLSPGARSPVHSHAAVEECYVIEGDFRFGDEVFGPGDYHCALAGSVHGKVHTVGGALVLIVAAESYESVRKTEIELEEQRRSLLALESRGQLWEKVKVEDEPDSTGQEMVIEDHQERCALYALGALSEHEARAFKIHLREGCAVCSKELSGFQAVVGDLALGAGSAPPPAGVVDKLLSRIEKESGLASSRDSSNDASNVKHSSLAMETAPPLRSSRGYLAWAVAASFFIISLVSIAAWWRVGSGLAEQKRLTAAFDEDLRRLKMNLNEESRKARDLELIAGALESPGSSVIKLASRADRPEAAPPAKIYWNHQTNQWVVALEMAAPPQGKVYQLWCVATTPVSAGVLKADDAGRGITVVSVPQHIGKIEQAAITIEPAGGSTTPTMPIVAAGEVER